MTAFLHRLARRAMGNASPVRSAPRSPWSAVPERPLANDGATAEAVWNPSVAALARGLAPPLQRVGATATGDPRHEYTQSPAHAHTPRASGASVTPTDRDRAPSPPSTLLPLDEDETAQATPHPGRSIHGASALPGSPKAAPTPPDGQDHLPAVSPLAPAETRQPAALLPPVPAPTPSLADPWTTAVPRSTRTADRATDTEPTEVHVTIGRIEVTAVREPAAAPKPAARRNAPMSLDEYLAQRRGGRP